MKNQIMCLFNMTLFAISFIVLFGTFYLCRVGHIGIGISIIISLVCLAVSALAVIAVNYYEYMIRRQKRINRNK